MSQRILLIGATSAIAQGAARTWAGRGDTLVLCGRHEDRLKLVAADLEVRGARQVEVLPADFDDTEALEQVFDRAAEAVGEIDVVLVAHGFLGDQQEAEHSYEETEKVLRVNFLSVVALLTPVANAFEARGAGTICVISSVAGDRGRQSNYVYGTAKGALNVFLQGLRNRLFKTGAKVVTVKPGFVSTPMTAHLDQGPLFADPDKIGKGVVDAVDRGADEVYLPGFWRPIMGVIRSIPEAVFKRLSL
jgi:decaprenylphospho-beta-D-erythro-pentofuranosid-2-ulose 2-reductase